MTPFLRSTSPPVKTPDLAETKTAIHSGGPKGAVAVLERRDQPSGLCGRGDPLPSSGADRSSRSVVGLIVTSPRRIARR
jgi:hypothetical protein